MAQCMGPSTLFLVKVVFHFCLEKKVKYLFFSSLEASKLQPWLILFPFVPDMVYEDREIMQAGF